jgi:hypothetical protein
VSASSFVVGVGEAGSLGAAGLRCISKSAAGGTKP